MRYLVYVTLRLTSASVGHPLDNSRQKLDYAEPIAVAFHSGDGTRSKTPGVVFPRELARVSDWRARTCLKPHQPKLSPTT